MAIVCAPKMLALTTTRCNKMSQLGRVFNNEACLLTHYLNGVPLDTLDEVFAGRNVVDETNDLSCGPYLYKVSQPIACGGLQKREGNIINLRHGPCRHL